MDTHDYFLGIMCDTLNKKYNFDITYTGYEKTADPKTLQLMEYDYSINGLNERTVKDAIAKHKTLKSLEIKIEMKCKRLRSEYRSNPIMMVEALPLMNHIENAYNGTPCLYGFVFYDNDISRNPLVTKGFWAEDTVYSASKVIIPSNPRYSEETLYEIEARCKRIFKTKRYFWYINVKGSEDPFIEIEGDELIQTKHWEELIKKKIHDREIENV